MESSTALEFVPGANFGVIQIVHLYINLYVHLYVLLQVIGHSAYQLAYQLTYKNTYNLHHNAATLALEWRLIARKT